MAQYGRNFYGASYYGATGVFVGQFVSDKTVLNDPIDGINTDGTLEIDLDTKLIWATYPYSDEVIFKRFGMWSENEGVSIYTSSTSSLVRAYIASSDIRLNFKQRDDGAKAKIDVIEYKLGEETGRQTYTVDTKTTANFILNDIDFNDYILEVRIDPSSPTGMLELSGIEIITTDVAVELRSREVTIDNDQVTETWTQYEFISLTRTYDEDTDTYRYNGKTKNIDRANGYQFKLLLATSDNTTSPEITNLHIHTGNNESYATDGYWKAVFDLGADFDPDTDIVEAVTYEINKPEGTNIEIRTRTTEDPAVNTAEDEDVSWGYWSAPYSTATKRLMFNIKDVDLEAIIARDPEALAQLQNGYLVGSIISPLYIPENLDEWFEFNPQYFVNYFDPITEELLNSSNNRNTYIKIKFLDEQLNPIIINKDKMEYILDTKTTDYQPLYDYIRKIKTPLRMEVEFYIKPGYSASVIDDMTLTAQAYYKETKRFLDFRRQENDGKIGYKGYASAVFGDNSGRDNVYLDGKPRAVLSSIGNFDFSLPEGVVDPNYYIQQPNFLNSEQGYKNLVHVFWASQKDPLLRKQYTVSQSTRGLENQHKTTVQDDHVMAEVIINEENQKIRKYRHHGSGITLKIEDGSDNYDSYRVSNVFYPPLDAKRLSDDLYAYHLKNGFDMEDTINKSVDIRWAEENNLDLPPELTELPWIYRRDISLYSNKNINTSIVSISRGDLVSWISKEKIMESMVNESSPVLSTSEADPLPKIIEINHDELPIINSDTIITSNNPYRVEIIDGSVASEGKIKNTNRINIEIVGIKYSINPSRNTDVKLIKSENNQDFLFRPNTTSIIDIFKYKQETNGEYILIDGNRIKDKTYKQGIHFNLINGFIDWTIGYNNSALISMMPKPMDELFVTYEYFKPEKLYIKYSCNYNRKHYDYTNIYKTPVKYYTGRCSYGFDYTSSKYNINEIWPSIPTTVDKNTLELKAVSIDNDYINIYTEDNKVIGTLGHTNPKENWYPQIKDGFYNIKKNNYFLFTAPDEIVLGKALVPSAENIEYTSGVIDQGLLIQEATNNLLVNTLFSETSDNLVEVFKETFER